MLLGAKKNSQPYTKDEIQRIENIMKPAHQNLGMVIYWHDTVEGVKIKVHEDEY